MMTIRIASDEEEVEESDEEEEGRSGLRGGIRLGRRWT